MKIAVLLLTLMAAAWASPVSFSKTSDGWSKVTSRSLAQQMVESMEESYGMPGTSNAERYDALESDDEDEWVRGPGDDDDDDKDNSGDGKRDREIRKGVCIHRGTQHTIERGSVEVHPALCLLCACQYSGTLRCIKTC